MKTRIARLALLSALALAPFIKANAYECLRTDLAKVHKDSTRIIIGEVVKIEVIKAAQGDEVMGEYVATLKPVEAFRGQPNLEVRVRFSALSRYFIITTDSEVIMTIGERYVLFENGPDTLRYDSVCADRVKKAGPDVVEYLRSHR